MDKFTKPNIDSSEKVDVEFVVKWIKDNIWDFTYGDCRIDSEMIGAMIEDFLNDVRQYNEQH